VTKSRDKVATVAETKKDCYRSLTTSDKVSSVSCEKLAATVAYLLLG